MVSTAQIAYPANDKEERVDSEVQTCEFEDELYDETACKDKAESCELDEHGAPLGRQYSVSPEDFCADSYTQNNKFYERQELGRRGEEAAVRYLEKMGYTILERNWFCKFGEADIIAQDLEGTICFIEVKTRQSVEAGFPEEAITQAKQSRYEKIALCYMTTDDWDDATPVRFDAIGICVTAPHKAMLRHHKGCFNGGF